MSSWGKSTRNSPRLYTCLPIISIITCFNILSQRVPSPAYSQHSHSLHSLYLTYLPSLPNSEYMRPTDIGLANPRAKTPGPYRVLTTHFGDYLGPVHRSFLRSGSFTRSRRFDQYRDLERRTGPVGPGSYSTSYTPKQAGGHIRISPLRLQRPGAYVTGHLIVCDPDLERWNQRLSPTRSKSKKKGLRKEGGIESLTPEQTKLHFPDLDRPETRTHLRRYRTNSGLTASTKLSPERLQS